MFKTIRKSTLNKKKSYSQLCRNFQMMCFLLCTRIEELKLLSIVERCIAQEWNLNWRIVFLSESIIRFIFQKVKYSVCLLILSSLYLSLNAQNVVGLAAAPVGTYQYKGPKGEREFINSVGNAKVGVFRKVQPPPFGMRVPLLNKPIRPLLPLRPSVKPMVPHPKKSPGVSFRRGIGAGFQLRPGLFGGLLLGTK